MNPAVIFALVWCVGSLLTFFLVHITTSEFHDGEGLPMTIFGSVVFWPVILVILIYYWIFCLAVWMRS